MRARHVRCVRYAAVAGLLAGSGLVMAGCGGSTSGAASYAGSTSAGTATAPASTGPAGTGVAVTEREFSITLPKTAFAAGTYTFTVTNAGSFGHNLTVKGPGVDSKATAVIQPGQSGSVTVTLQKGSYELWCSVDGHKDRGMDTHITVS